MKNSKVRVGARKACLLLTVAMMSALPLAAFSDPPAHAPAHGWRKKHDPNYQGYTGKKWDQDYGVIQGRCYREAAGAAIGGAVGGVIGAQVGDGDGRKIAIIVGSVLGAMLGAKIGRDMDNADRACIGHALELAGDKRSVAWNSGNVSYMLTPTGGFKRGVESCRNYTLTIKSGGKNSEKVDGAACRSGADGTWQVVR